MGGGEIKCRNEVHCGVALFSASTCVIGCKDEQCCLVSQNAGGIGVARAATESLMITETTKDLRLDIITGYKRQPKTKLW
jgi:hypothetical protein